MCNSKDKAQVIDSGLHDIYNKYQHETLCASRIKML